MSRKDYIQLANALAILYRQYPTAEARAVLSDVVVALSDVCRRDNSRFDRERFAAAVGFEGEAA